MVYVLRYVPCIVVAPATTPSVLLHAVHSATAPVSGCVTLLVLRCLCLSSTHFSTTSRPRSSVRIRSPPFLGVGAGWCHMCILLAHLILFRLITSDSCFIPVKSYTRSLLLPLLAQTTPGGGLFQSILSVPQNSLLVVLSVRSRLCGVPHRMSILGAVVRLLALGGSLINLLTSSHAALAFCVLYLWCRVRLWMFTPRWRPSPSFQSFTWPHSSPSSPLPSLALHPVLSHPVSILS